MGAEKNLISLKEAAKLTGYTADYIGQLIRAGKIPGKQVYSNIAWMTTVQDVLDYKNKGQNTKNSVGERIKTMQRKIAMEINILKMLFFSSRYTAVFLIVLFLSFALINIFLVYYFSQRSSPSAVNPAAVVEEKPISF